MPDKIEVVYKDDSNNIKKRKTVKVDYPWKPLVCSHCDVFGHSMQACKIRPRTSEEKENENENVQNKKSSVMNQENQIKKDENGVNIEVQNKDSDGFVEARGRWNNGRNKQFQQKKQLFRPKEKQVNEKENGDLKRQENGQDNMNKDKGKSIVNEQNNGGEGTSKTPPLLEKSWRVSPETVKDIHRCAN